MIRTLFPALNLTNHNDLPDSTTGTDSSNTTPTTPVTLGTHTLSTTAPTAETTWDLTPDLPEVAAPATPYLPFTQGNPQSTWNIQDDLLFDDLPDLSAMNDTDLEHVVDHLLVWKTHKLTLVTGYIKDNNICSIPQTAMDPYNLQQYFINEGLAYPLNEDQVYAIENLLSDLGNNTAVAKTLVSSPLQFKGLLPEITSIFEKHQIKDQLIADISSAFVAKLTLKCISYLYTSKLQKLFQNDEGSFDLTSIKFPMNSTSTTIGNAIIESYVYKNILYHEASTEAEVISTHKYRKVTAQRRISNEQLLDVLADYKKVSPHTKNDIFTITQAYLTLFAEEFKIIPGLPEEVRSQYQTSLQKYAQTCGYLILDLLIASGLIQKTSEEILHKNQGRKNIPHIRLKAAAIKDVLKAPLSFSQPKLSVRPLPIFKQICDASGNVDLQITPNFQSKIFFRENTRNLVPTPELKEALNVYNEVPHVINEDILQHIITLYKQVSAVTSNILDNDLVKDYFKSIFFIDLKPIIKHTLANNPENMGVLGELVEYSLLLSTYFNKDLQQKVQGHASFLNIYNVVSAYKIILLYIEESINCDISPSTSTRFLSLTRYFARIKCSSLINVLSLI